MKPLLFTLAAILVVSSSTHAAPKRSAADEAWIEKCTNRLVTESLKKTKASRIYCTCMHEMVENNEEMSQSDLEHSWPPVHLSCRKEAGWHREKHP